jgi:hypothetical protein
MRPTEGDVTIGPVEYAVFGFAAGDASGEVSSALGELVRNGTIRILDLVFVVGGEERFDVLEYEDVEGFPGFGDLDGEVGGLIGPEDIEYVADGLAPDTSVALLVWEDVWAARLFRALQSAGGVVLESARIPHDLIDHAMKTLSPAS